MEYLSTIVICVILAAVCVYAVLSYRKKIKNGCCGGGGEEIKIKPSDSDVSHYPHKSLMFY